MVVCLVDASAVMKAGMLVVSSVELWVNRRDWRLEEQLASWSVHMPAQL